MNKQHLTYGFVILHYIALEMTKQCVDNLLEKFGYEDIFIVIVDNKSPNGSGIELHNYYESKKQVKVILHDKNDGFARGNNVGFDYNLQNDIIEIDKLKRILKTI